MKRSLVIVVVAPLCVILALWAWAFALRRRYDARTWPDNLGTLETAPRHFKTQPNAAGLRLTSMPTALDRGPESLRDYLKTELERSTGEIAAPPPGLAAYLREQSAQLDLIRDHILAAGEVRNADFRLHFGLTKRFVARAFMNGSWDDLHAAWLLDRPLWERQQEIPVALYTTRMLNAAAAKMPLPVPPWLDELRSFDYERRVAAAYQADTFDSRQITDQVLGEHRLMSLIDGWDAVASNADFSEQVRVRTGELLASKSCDFANDPLIRKPLPVASWNATGHALGPLKFLDWSSVARFRVEREATDKILALRRGETPSAATRCSDGTWSVSALGVKFSRDIAVRDEIKYPLAYQR